ncbi:MAG: serine/threonine protein kinase, partial [Acidobacteria bacterium]|nr:serine/threonine protein kinase [Acidobacteriota bacterium]
MFESDNPMQMMMHHANTKPTPPSSVSEVSIRKSLDELVLACLQKSPDDRPGSADEVWQMLG